MPVPITSPAALPAAHRLGAQPRTVAVLRALHLGDLLCTVPALRALRAGLPDARISLIGLPWARAFVERFGAYIDEFVEFQGFPGLPERACQPRAVARFLAQMRERQFDLAIQLHGDGAVTNRLVSLLGARLTAGFVGHGGWAPDDGLFLPYPTGLPEPRRHLELVRFLGLPLHGEELEFPLTPADRADAGRAAQRKDLGHEYAIVHPGSRAGDRRWSEEGFAGVADHLADEGLAVVLTGTEEEAEITGGVASRMRAKPVDLTGRTTLGALGVLVAGARMVVCNDTGMSHVAAALRTPSVVVFSASDPLRWAPRDRQRHRVVVARNGGAVDAVIAHV
ncbi:MAG TPA: glycosyltransferase family 9 protein, partial [Candidatus Caenarcaniphilales bacterium]|nr:glycosyltransferase family 9 protein [Candidatus Caenarcaniphilales bacterium]